MALSGTNFADSRAKGLRNGYVPAVSTREGAPYWPALDGLRGVAMLIVIVAHAGFIPRGSGGIGVTVFFVLSGFLITQVLLRREHGLGHFYANRAVRLVPALVLMVVVVGVLWLVQGRAAGTYAEYAFASLLYVENFFPVSHALEVLNHCWSLAVEEQFYLLWPLVLPFFIRRSVQSRFWWGCMFVAVLAALRLAVHVAGFPLLSYVSLPTNAYALLMGCLLALAPWPPAWRRTSLAGGLLLLVFALAAVPFAPGQVISGALIGAGAATLLVHGAVQGSALLSWLPLRFAGRISYAWYLWHWPLLWLSGTTFDGVGALPMIGVSFVVAVASTVWLEEPLRAAWRRRSVSRVSAPHVVVD